MTKIDIFSGFLGAGKTTLIKKLLKEALSGEKVVLIENEFGEIGIDGGFMKEAGIQVTEMNSGCICCSLVGDFGEALKKVIDQYHPDRILIEPSGVGKLSDVIRAVEGVEKDIPEAQMGSFVTVADAMKCRMYVKNFGEFFLNQIEYAGTILLSRTQKLSQEKLQAAIDLLREHNAKARIITTPWDELTGAQILAAMEDDHSLAEDMLATVMAEQAAHDEDDDDDECCHHHHHHDHDGEEDEHDHECHHHHHHDDDDDDEVFKNQIIRTDYVFTKEELESILSKVDEDIIRIKGYVNSNEGTLYLNYVLNEYHIYLGEKRDESLVSIIGTKIDRNKYKEVFHG